MRAIKNLFLISMYIPAWGKQGSKMFIGQSRLSEDRIARHLDIFEALVRNYSPGYGPMRAGLCDVRRGLFSQFKYADAGDDKVAWAISYLEHLQNHAGLGNIKIQYTPLAPSAYERECDNDLSRQMSGQDRFWSDILGFPIVYFNPERIVERGYLSSLAAHNFSEILLACKKVQRDIDGFDDEEKVRAMSSFLGLGLATLKPANRKAKPEAEIPDKAYVTALTDATFLSALFLAIKGYNAERMTQIYSGRIDAPVMVQMRRSFDRLEAYKSRTTHLRDLIICAQNNDRQDRNLRA